MHHNISALRMSGTILVILFDKSFDVAPMELDISLNPSDPLVESGDQY
jgi:hypothetical protein